MGEERLVPFLAAVIGTPPVGSAGILPASGLATEIAPLRSVKKAAQSRPYMRKNEKMSARRHLKYYLKVFRKSLFSKLLVGGRERRSNLGMR
jgi:hypothetical protein